MANIFDTLKGAGLSGALGLVKLLIPEPFKPLLDQIQTDISAGKVTVDNVVATFDAVVTTIEGYTGPEWDAALESYKLLLRAGIDAEQKTVIAINKK